LNFLFLLDGDRQGIVERERYATNFGIPIERLALLDELVPGAKVIEDLLDEHAKAKIQKELGLIELPKKSQIMRFFQERLASDKVENLSPEFENNVKMALDGLRSRLAD
jgi:hypothetical protein